MRNVLTRNLIGGMDMNVSADDFSESTTSQLGALISRFDEMETMDIDDTAGGGSIEITNFMEMDVSILNSIVTTSEEQSRKLINYPDKTGREKFIESSRTIAHLARLIKLIERHKLGLKTLTNSSFDLARLKMMEQMLLTIMNTHRQILAGIEL